MKSRIAATLTCLGRPLTDSPMFIEVWQPFRFQKTWATKDLACEPCISNTRSGIWDIKKNGITEKFAPPINRSPLSRYVADSLCEEQKNQRAGVNAGHWSPFRTTKEKIVRHVRENEPCTLKSTIEAIEHHYSSDSSAYCSVGKWIREGVIDEVEMTKDGLVIA